MWRSILLFMLGVFSGAIVVGAVSVYAFHDVDRDQVGHWNAAFAGLCFEFFLFTLIVGGGVALLTFLARLVLRLKGYAPRTSLSFFLGTGVSVLQYAWDFLGRRFFPDRSDDFLSIYLIAAIVLSAAMLVLDSFMQKRLRQAYVLPLQS